MKRSMWVTGVATALALTASACGSDAAEETAVVTTEASAETTTEVPETGVVGVTVDGAWARMSPMMADTGAAYMSLTSGVDDALLGASVDASVAARVEVHEVVMADDEMTEDTMGGDEMGEEEMMQDMEEGAMVMQEVESITLAAGETVMLAPGGFHIMLLELAAPLVEGESFDLTLDFAEAGPMTITVDILAEAP